ncbi:MAG TPA: zf-HC2 domain-containing protein [Pyrinomonadaceae bacterium]|nr:zf-HC2 domain-containing protein [Pyrinomonadaceae bacterium]
MRCEEYQSKVEDYFDGELDEQTTDLVAQHLAACRLCANVYSKLEREQELYLQYECEAQVSPAFWDNVMARSTQNNTAHAFQPLYGLRGWLANISAPRFSPSLTALLVLVAIGVTIAVMRYVNSGERSASPAISVSQNGGAPAPLPLTTAETGVNLANQNQDNGTTGEGSKAGLKEPPQLERNSVGRRGKFVLAAGGENAGRINRRPQANGRKPTPDELVREAEQKYVAAIAMLSRDVNSRRSRLDPKMAARFEQTLAAVERTISDTRRAVREHPGDPVAAQYMLTAYAKKVDVLREMASF